MAEAGTASRRLPRRMGGAGDGADAAAGGGAAAPAQNGAALPSPGPPGMPPGASPMLNSSPYLRNMALLDEMDLQRLMAGGDLNADAAAAAAGHPEVQRSPEAALAALSTMATTQPGANPRPAADDAPPSGGMRRLSSHEQLTAMATAVTALRSPRDGQYRDLGVDAAAPPSPPSPPPPPSSRPRRETAGARSRAAAAAPAAPAGDAEQQRKDVRRERNREHARISRERKRQKLEHLQEENDALRRKEGVLVDERNRLRARVDAAERDVAQLRAFIATHRDKLGDVAAPMLGSGGAGGGA